MGAFTPGCSPEINSTNGTEVMDMLGHFALQRAREDLLHQGGATICLVAHDPRYADRAARTIHLFDGEIVPGPV